MPLFKVVYTTESILFCRFTNNKSCLFSLPPSRTLIIPAIFGKTENGGQDLAAEKYSNKYIMLTWQQQLRTQAAGCPCCAMTFMQRQDSFKINLNKSTLQISRRWWIMRATNARILSASLRCQEQ